MPRISKWWWREITGQLDRNWDEIWGEPEPDWTAVVDLMFYIIIKMRKHRQNSAPWSRSNENKMVLTSSTAFGNPTCALLWDADRRADDTCTRTPVFMRTHGFLYHLVKWNLNCCWAAHWSRTKYPHPWGSVCVCVWLQITDVPVTPRRCSIDYWQILQFTDVPWTLHMKAICMLAAEHIIWGPTEGVGVGATAAHCIGSLWEF